MYQITRLADAQLDANDSNGKIAYSTNNGSTKQLFIHLITRIPCMIHLVGAQGLPIRCPFIVCGTMDTFFSSSMVFLKNTMLSLAGIRTFLCVRGSLFAMVLDSIFISKVKSNVFLILKGLRKLKYGGIMKGEPSYVISEISVITRRPGMKATIWKSRVILSLISIFLMLHYKRKGLINDLIIAASYSQKSALRPSVSPMPNKNTLTMIL